MARTRPLSFAAAAALILALLLAQALGLAHRGAHGQGLGPAVAVAVADQSRSAAPQQGLQAVFGEHERGSDCRLFDALTHEPAAPSAESPLAPPPALATIIPIAGPGGRFAAAATPFDARGPPARS